MNLQFLLAVVFSILVHKSNAFSTGAAGCVGGEAAVGGFHLDDDDNRAVIPGPLEAGAIAVSVGDVVLDPDETTNLPIGQDLLIEVLAQDIEYKGMLVRLEAPAGIDTSGALTVGLNTQTAAVCTAPLVGITHTNNSLKLLSTGMVRFDEEVLDATLDVTVVFLNNGSGSAFVHDTFELNFRQLTPAPSPSPSESPTDAPTTMIDPADPPVPMIVPPDPPAASPTSGGIVNAPTDESVDNGAGDGASSGLSGPTNSALADIMSYLDSSYSDSDSNSKRKGAKGSKGMKAKGSKGRGKRKGGGKMKGMGGQKGRPSSGGYDDDYSSGDDDDDYSSGDDDTPISSYYDDDYSSGDDDSPSGGLYDDDYSSGYSSNGSKGSRANRKGRKRLWHHS